MDQDTVEILVIETDPVKLFKNYALYGAVLEGDEDAVSTLLSRGADPNFKPREESSLSEVFMMHKNKEKIKKLLADAAAEISDEENTAEVDFETFKNYALVGAVSNDDIDAARSFLVRGADPNYKTKSNQHENLFDDKGPEFDKLLLEFGFVLDKLNIRHIFGLTYVEYMQEMLPLILKNYIKDDKLVLCIFFELIQTHDNLGASELEIFKLLVERGLPVDDYLLDEDDGSKTHTTLHYAIQNFGFVSHLVELGADVNKKTLDSDGYTPLILAVERSDKFVVKLLLRKGARVNEKATNGLTALHMASGEQYPSIDVIYILLEHGADVNATAENDNYETPFTLAERDEVKEIMVKEFAKLRFENKEVSSTNIAHLRDDFYEDDHFENIFNSSLKELEKLKGHKIFNDLSLYDILKMRGQHKKLVSLTKREEFVEAFESNWNRESYKNYAKELDRIIIRASEMRDVIQAEKKNFYESGVAKKFLIPAEIVDMILDYVTDHCYYE